MPAPGPEVLQHGVRQVEAAAPLGWELDPLPATRCRHPARLLGVAGAFLSVFCIFSTEVNNKTTNVQSWARLSVFCLRRSVTPSCLNLSRSNSGSWSRKPTLEISWETRIGDTDRVLTICNNLVNVQFVYVDKLPLVVKLVLTVQTAIVYLPLLATIILQFKYVNEYVLFWGFSSKLKYNIDKPL